MSKNTENILAQIEKKIDTYIAGRQRELQEIEDRRTAAQHDLETAQAEKKNAAFELNEKKYRQAEEMISYQSAIIRMCQDKAEVIAAADYISEAESDKVVDSLLEHQDYLTDKFIKDISGPIGKLREIYNSYIQEVEETEQTINRWTEQIRPNYSTRGGTVRIDEQTGERTDRATHPVPVRQTPFRGCPESFLLKEYLEKAEDDDDD